MIDDFNVGDRFITSDYRLGLRELKILAIVDKHIMCKFTRCIPFVKSVKEFPRYLESIKAVRK